jgi:hypothetical protein
VTPEASYSQATRICTRKDCSLAGVPQRLSEFVRNRFECNTCTAAYMRRYRDANRARINDRVRISQRAARAANREKHRLLSTMKRFRRQGATEAWYDEQLRKQQFGCAICGSTASRNHGPRFAIDHNHKCCPKKRACDKCRRGLLCGPCNTRLGVLEAADWVQKANAYLSRFRGAAE